MTYLIDSGTFSLINNGVIRLFEPVFSFVQIHNKTTKISERKMIS